MGNVPDLLPLGTDGGRTPCLGVHEDRRLSSAIGVALQESKPWCIQEPGVGRSCPVCFGSVRSHQKHSLDPMLVKTHMDFVNPLPALL